MVLNQDPEFVSALTNLGYLWLEEKNEIKAKLYYNKALSLNPDDEQALMNMVGLHIYRKEYKEALKYIERTLKVNNKNKQAQQLKLQLTY